MKSIVLIIALFNSVAGFGQSFLPAFKCSNFGKPVVAKKANQSYSDTLDILHYNIALDISNLNSRSIAGSCTIQAIAKVSALNIVKFDLLALTVDSVIIDNQAAAFQHNDTLLEVNLSPPFQSGDTLELTIYYGGQPVMDASGWGGFYFSGSYAYNLGVGFAADPHNYGRVWFPCIDNFVDRATYDFFITTDPDDRAFCNGMLMDTSLSSNGVTWHWQMNQSIPTYLASVAVADYTSVDTSFQSIAGNMVPVSHAARSNDTSNLKKSFQHLDECFQGFESRFGPYFFDRVGFTLVPFNSGAMEHATNIAYPRAAANGSLSQETLMAHEFAHHWWGDLVTCSTAEDMWLNEGWASYSEKIFLEYVYGRQRYDQEVLENHEAVLRTAHFDDGGYLPVSGIGHSVTYGTTVYDKGADVAHTLRAYLGDSLFFHCLTDFLDTYKFTDVSSEDFRDHLSTCSGHDLTHFFDNWVFQPGFPHFSIDSFVVTGTSGSYDVVVFVRQRLKEAPDYYSGVPIELTYMSEAGDSLTEQIWFTGTCGVYSTSLSFEPEFVGLDLGEKISDAITGAYWTIDTPGNYQFNEGWAILNVDQVNAAAKVRIEHNWLAPDRFVNPVSGLYLSTERYWKIDGIFPNDFDVSATFLFNGAGSSSMDFDLMSNSEDSLAMVYRASSGEDWSIIDSFQVNTQGSANNRVGTIEVLNLKRGEYAMAIWDAQRQDTLTLPSSGPCLSLGIDRTNQSKVDFNIFPNPATDSFTAVFSEAIGKGEKLVIYELSGREAKAMNLSKGIKEIEISMQDLESGVYFISKQNKNGASTKQLIVVNKK